METMNAVAFIYISDIRVDLISDSSGL
jgi:hypothetical protein